MPEPTNASRIDRARLAIDAHWGNTGHEPLEEKLTDLLTDLRHLSREQGIDFEAALLSSENHFQSEPADAPAPVSFAAKRRADFLKGGL